MWALLFRRFPTHFTRILALALVSASRAARAQVHVLSVSTDLESLQTSIFRKGVLVQPFPHLVVTVRTRGHSLGFSGGGISLGFELAQGSSRTLTSTTPSVTLMNGGIGTINSGAIVPFATGVVPVVGASAPIDNGVTRGIASGQLRPYSESRVEANRIESNRPIRTSKETSSAASSDISVAEIKARNALAKTSRLQQRDEAIRLAKAAYENENYSRSRIELRKAINLTDDESELRKFKKWMKALHKK